MASPLTKRWRQAVIHHLSQISPQTFPVKEKSTFFPHILSKTLSHCLLKKDFFSMILQQTAQKRLKRIFLKYFSTLKVWNIDSVGYSAPSDKVWLSAADGWAREANTWLLADWKILSTNFAKYWCSPSPQILSSNADKYCRNPSHEGDWLPKPSHRIQMASWRLVWY